jgi:hypothetical protein
LSLELPGQYRGDRAGDIAAEDPTDQRTLHSGSHGKE